MRFRVWSAAIVVAATAALAPGAGAAMRPTIRIAQLKPSVAVAGAQFRARERVRVILSTGSLRRTDWVRTTGRGTFSADLGALPDGFDPCSDFLLVLARGRSGDEAAVKYVPRECPPR